ncbi:b(0,+)-type amino acid transporter 1-like [Ixodes scapularis]
MAALLPAAGGSYAYVTAGSKAMGRYGDIVPFMHGWSMLMMADPMNAAFQGITFASYALSPVYGDCSQPYTVKVLVALTFTALGTALNCFSVKTSAWVQNVLSALKFLVLVSIIITGSVWLFKDNKLLDSPFFTLNTNPANIVEAFYGALTCYSGWQHVTYIAEEISDPNRTIPLALTSGILVVSLINIFSNLAYFVVLDADTVAKSEAIAVSFAAVTWGTAAASCFPVIVAISAFGNLCGGFFSSSRLILAAARQGQMPSVFSLVTVKSSVPLTSVLLRGFLSLVYTFAGSVSFIINSLSFVVALNETLTMICFLVLRYSMKDAPRPFRVPTALSVFYLVILILLVVIPLTSPSEYMQYVVVVVGYLVGILCYVLFIRFDATFPGADAISIIIQKCLMCVPCLNELEIMLKERF